MPDFSVQNNFPMSAVIQAAQENADRQQRALESGQQSLVSGLQSIGQVGQSLLDRRRAMAQAMAGAQLYANTPEGKEMLGTNQVTTGPSGQSVTPSSTANYNPTTGSATPNGSPIDLQTLALAFMGDKPSDVMNQMFQRHKLNVESGLEAQRIAGQQQIAQILAGFKGREVATQETHTGAEDVNALLTRRAELTKDLPKGWWDSVNNDQAIQAKQQIAQIDAQLASKGYKGDLTAAPSSSGASGIWTATPNGTRYKIGP